MVISDASPTAPSFPSCRKRRGRKECLVTVWCFLPLNLGEALFFRCRSTRWSPYGFFDYAPPDTGVPNLQLVSVEYLPSIEGALEIQMNVTFLRGKAPLPGELSAQLTERSSQICDCRLPPAAPSFPSCRKRRGRKGALGDAGCFLPLNLGGNQCFIWRSTRYSPHGRLSTRRLIRGYRVCSWLPQNDCRK